MTITLSDIRRYPVKSCRGESLPEAVVEPWGLAGDRRWMVVDDAGDTLTAREHPRLVLVTPRWTPDGGLDLTGPDGGTVHVPPPDAEPQDVLVHDSPVRARPADDAGLFASLLGVSCGLVILDDPTHRGINPRFGRPDDRVSLADAYPVLLASTSSLAALNEWTPEPMSMTRFRPNLVVDGAEPWAEDGWRVVRIGEAVFRSVKGCDRCVLTTVDPETARKGKEPIRTLAQHRRFDGRTFFAMNLIPDTPGVTIAVGDEVEVLEQADAGGGPPR
ncbi:MAG: MOSC domain-containing protein [Jatrophihabitans sp.]|uniref:MOSC domain-containing protein n=1 Tax=Jatrophihabitans sp. TaxID=1932789 RepID=UPI003F7F82A2